MITKRQLLSLLSFPVMAAVSCGPSVYTVDVELRTPSSSGMDLSGKSMSVVFVDNSSKEDSLFAANVAQSFAAALDQDYFGGDSLVGVYSIRPSGNAYTHRDSVISLVMETGSDVLFLFDKPEFGSPELSDFGNDGTKPVVSGIYPFKLNLYVYDTMDPADTVRHFSENCKAEAYFYADRNASRAELVKELKANLTAEALKTGKKTGQEFVSQWKMETYPFFVFDSQIWYDTAYMTGEYKWREAIETWMSLLDTENMQKRACLEYNIAGACYMMGEYELAMKWITMSENDYDLPYTSTAKKKIQLRMMSGKKRL